MSAITVRVPDSIYGHLKKVAQNDGMSVNQFFVTAVAEKLSALETEEYLKNEGAKGSAAQGFKILAKAPKRAPDPGDELPASYVKPAARKVNRR